MKKSVISFFIAICCFVPMFAFAGCSSSVVDFKVYFKNSVFNASEKSVSVNLVYGDIINWENDFKINFIYENGTEKTAEHDENFYLIDEENIMQQQTLNAGTYVIKVGYKNLYELEIVFNIKKAQGLILNVSDISKVFDGDVVDTPTYEIIGDGKVTVYYKKADELDSAYSTTKPFEVGEYVFRIYLSSSINYTAALEEREFSIIAN